MHRRTFIRLSLFGVRLTDAPESTARAVVRSAWSRDFGAATRGSDFFSCGATAAGAAGFTSPGRTSRFSGFAATDAAAVAGAAVNATPIIATAQYDRPGIT